MKRKILIFLCFILFIISIAAVSAADEMAEINDNADDLVSVSYNDVSNDLLSDDQVDSADSGNFVDNDDFKVGDVSNGNSNDNNLNESKINVNNITMYYRDGTRFAANLTDGDGNPLAGMSLSATINGQTRNYTTDDNGGFSFGLNLNPGTYPVEVTFLGDSTYQPSTALSNVEIKHTLHALDLVKMFKDDLKYEVLVSQNRTLENIPLALNINGRIYNRTTNQLGIASLAINLIPGKYIITAERLDTGEKLSTNIIVNSLLSENNNISMYFKDGTAYAVKVTKQDGTVAGAGEVVTFNINGVLYDRVTNESGYAKLNINLPPGYYIITAEYKGCKVSNYISIAKVIQAYDLRKSYGSSDKFYAILLDSQGSRYPNQTVKFNINGVIYDRVTDEDGTAWLNINLLPGHYIITSTSPNGNSISNEIWVTDPVKVNTTMDVGQYVDGEKKTSEWHYNSEGVVDGYVFYPRLTDINGNVLEKQIVLKCYNRENVLLKTIQGISTSPMYLMGDDGFDFPSYRGIVYIQFEGDSQYNPSNVYEMIFGKS